jgi:uncharacterized protein DUF202
VTGLRRWLRTPLGWFSFILAEYVVAVGLLRIVLPDKVPLAAGLAVIVAVVAALFVFNLRIRRWIAAADRDR